MFSINLGHGDFFLSSLVNASVRALFKRLFHVLLFFAGLFTQHKHAEALLTVDLMLPPSGDVAKLQIEIQFAGWFDVNLDVDIFSVQLNIF